MLLFIIGGCLLANLAEKVTSKRVRAKRLKAAKKEWPEIEIIQTKHRVYLTAEQRLLGEGGDMFLFMMHSTEEALGTIHRERMEAERRARRLGLQP